MGQRYRTPLSGYWGKFQEAYYIMESEHTELERMAGEQDSIVAVVSLRDFQMTEAIIKTYAYLIIEFATKSADDKLTMQKKTS
jgi:hypothetical protein